MRATIPLELIEQFERGNVLLFLGERLAPQPDAGGLEDRLRAALIARCAVAGSERFSFPQLAQIYEDEHGRHALVQLVRDQLAAAGDAPPALYRQLPSVAPQGVFVSTALDRAVERAFEEAGAPLDTIVRDSDVAYGDQRRGQLFRLRGVLDQPESLVLSEEDYERFFESNGAISVVLQGYLASMTILFLGYALDDANFQRLYRKVIGALDKHARRSYAVGGEVGELAARWCRRNSITVLPGEAAAFLEALAPALRARQRAAPGAPAPAEPDAAPAPVPVRPYKLLDYYEAADAAIFFGREAERDELAARIRAHRLTLIYGASGVGKTSLLLAGALPRLKAAEPPFEPFYIRALEDPAVAIQRAVSRRLGEAHHPAEGGLASYLAAAAPRLSGTPLIILDQFEEFFIRLSPQFRARFVEELGVLCDARDMPLKIVICLREDWLAPISELRRRIPEVFSNAMRVLPFTREQARRAIVDPVRPLGREYEPALLERMLSDLADARGAVMPPQLQLVCSALYAAVPAGADTIALAAYESLGTARGILLRYLEDELGRLGRDERLIARTVLAELVTSRNTKAVKTEEELARGVGVDPPVLLPVLAILVNARLLRRLEQESGLQAYELSHEYLIGEIELDPSTRQRKQAEELIGQEVENWQRFGTLLASDKMALIGEVRSLLRLSGEAQELLLRSALESDDSVTYWLERVEDHDRRAAVLRERATARTAQVRRRAAAALGTQDAPESVAPLVELALRDADAEVRATARVSLAQLAAQRPLALAQLGEALAGAGRAERQAILQILGYMPLGEIPAGLRNQVLLARARRRGQETVAAVWATPGRRAAALTGAAFLMIFMLGAVAGLNTYFLDIGRPISPRGGDNQVVVRRGLPFLPGLSAEVVVTDVQAGALQGPLLTAVIEKRIWGVWLLRGQRDYLKWGKDLAVSLDAEEGIPLLWYLDPREGQKWLVEAYNSDDPRARLWAVGAMADLLAIGRGEAAYLDLLRADLDDPDDELRLAAAAALISLEDLAAPERAAIVADTVLPALASSDYQTQVDARSMLRGLRLGAADIPILLPAVSTLLADESGTVRYSALEVLDNLAFPAGASTEFRALVAPMLADQDSSVRSQAALLLSEYQPDPEQRRALLDAALPELEANVRQGSYDYRYGLMLSGLRLDTEATDRVANRLAPTLAEGRPDEQQRALEILGSLQLDAGGAALIAGLVRPLLASPDPDVQLAAAELLAESGRDPALARELIALAEPIISRPGGEEYGEYRISEVLVDLARNPRNNRELAALSVELLGRNDSFAPQVAVRVIGALTLTEREGRELIAALTPLTTAAAPWERRQALWALATLDAPPGLAAAAVGLASPLLTDPDPEVRLAAATVVLASAQHGDRLSLAALDAARAVLRDPDPAIRITAAAVLTERDLAPELAPDLIKVLVSIVAEERPELQARALYLLSLLTPDAELAREVAAAVTPLLADDRFDLRYQVLAVLTNLRAHPETAVAVAPFVLPLALEPDLEDRAELLNILSTLRLGPEVPPEVRAGYEQLLNDPDPSVRYVAIRALSRSFAAREGLGPDEISPLIAQLADQRRPTQRLIAAYSLFFAAAERREAAGAIRAALAAPEYANLRDPVQRLWVSRLLVMLDIADLRHELAAATQAQQSTSDRLREAAPSSGERGVAETRLLEIYKDGDLFGPEVNLAADEAIRWSPVRLPRPESP